MAFGLVLGLRFGGGSGGSGEAYVPAPFNVMVGGQSLMAHMFQDGSPRPAIPWAQAFQDDLGITPTGRSFTVWSGGAGVSDETSPGAGNYSARIVNGSSDGSALVGDWYGAGSTSDANYWYNLYGGNSGVTGNSLDDTANSPGPLWRALMTLLTTYGADTFIWSQGESDVEAISNTPSRAPTWGSVLEMLFAAVRSQVGKSYMPIFIHHLGRHDNDTGDNNGSQLLRDQQTLVAQQTPNVAISSEQYDTRPGLANIIANCTITSGSNAVTTSTDTSSFMNTGDVFVGPGLPNATTVTGISGTSPTFTITLNATASASSTSTCYREDPVHPYPSSADSGTMDQNAGLYLIAKRTALNVSRYIKKTAVRNNYGPYVSAIAAQVGTNHVDLTVTHDLGTTLTTRNGTISGTSNIQFLVNNNGNRTISNVQKLSDGSGTTTLRLTLSSNITDGNVSLTVAYGVMNNTDYTNFIIDNATVPMSIESQSPATNAALSITAAQGSPINSVQPEISGSSAIGTVLSTSNGTWTESPTGYTYQWRSNGTAITGQTANSYTLVSGDTGNMIDVVVTATNATGSASASSSNSIVAGVTYVNSVQNVTLTMASGSTSASATINAVGPKAFIVYQGHTCSNASTSSYPSEMPRCYLAGSTSVNCSRISSSSDSVTVNLAVIDPTDALVDSVQAGTVTITGSGVTTSTATVSAVDPTRSAIFYGGHRTNYSANIDVSYPSLALTNGTTVTGTVGAPPGSDYTSVSFYVVQFNANAIESLQALSSTFGNSSMLNTVALSTIVTANSIVAFQGISTSNSAYSTFFNVAAITGTNQLTWTRGAYSINAYTVNATVIEFKPGVLKSLQRGTITLTAVASNTATISAVDTTKTFLNYTGIHTTATAPSETFTALSMTNGTTITANKNTAGSATTAIGYTAAEFN